MFALAPSPAPTSPDVFVTPNVTAQCKDDRFCQQVLDWTHNQWLANSSYVVIVKPLRIIGIILAALLIRWMLHRAIRRLTASTTRASMPALLKPLREKRAAATAEDGQFIPERRRQRAEAIGSVLRSFVTATVFSLATLMVLNEFGFDLGPLLASAGIVGVALGFGAQSLVKDLIAGLFMLLEDQYGVGDTVDLGEATGVVETVGLRITTVRDARGVLWYIRNGEIVRVGNKSQGWAMVVVDVPIGFVNSETASAVLRRAAERVAAEPEHQSEFLEPPTVVGVEQLTVDGAVIRTIAKTTADARVTVQRALQQALTESLENTGLSERIAASRLVPRSAIPPEYTPTEAGNSPEGGM